jgi:hypothetical protein
MLDDALQHGRDEKGIADPFLPRGGQPGGGLEGLELHHAAAGIGRGEHRRDAGDVVRRHGDDDRVGLVGGGELHRAEDVGGQVLMPQDRRLGRAGGAAGEQLHGDRARVFAGHRRRAAVVRQRQQRRAVEHGDAVDGVDLRPLLGPRDHQDRRDAREQGVDLGARQAVIDRHVGQAGIGSAIERDHRRRAGDIQQGDVLRARGLEVAGRPVGLLAQVGVAQAPLARDHRGAVREGLGGHVEQGSNVHEREG